MAVGASSGVFLHCAEMKVVKVAKAENTRFTTFAAFPFVGLKKTQSIYAWSSRVHAGAGPEPPLRPRDLPPPGRFQVREPTTSALLHSASSHRAVGSSSSIFFLLSRCQIFPITDTETCSVGGRERHTPDAQIVTMSLRFNRLKCALSGQQ